MDGSIIQTYLSDILHAVAQSLLAPDIVLLLVFIGYALFCIGSIIAESFSERRHFNVVMPKFLAALMAAKEDEIPAVIEQSGLLNRQKIALLTVYDYRMLPGDALVALIRRLVNEEETRYDRITGRNNMAARISPMLGLMGTLIPLGPGIQALGNADTATLSSSLLVAFDTTVAGLVTAAVCLVVGKIRTNWYGNYMSALDSAMATMLQKIEDMRAEGKITVEEPSDYAFLYESKRVKPAKHEDKPEEDVSAPSRASNKRGSHVAAGASDKTSSFEGVSEADFHRARVSANAVRDVAAAPADSNRTSAISNTPLSQKAVEASRDAKPQTSETTPSRPSTNVATTQTNQPGSEFAAVEWNSRTSWNTSRAAEGDGAQPRQSSGTDVPSSR
jgi:biopolymer transport protein ExbB/TolQ